MNDKERPYPYTEQEVLENEAMEKVKKERLNPTVTVTVPLQIYRELIEIVRGVPDNDSHDVEYLLDKAMKFIPKPPTNEELIANHQIVMWRAMPQVSGVNFDSWEEIKKRLREAEK